MIKQEGKIDCCYLVDSENVKDTWIDLLDTMKEEDRLLVFYTVNSAHIRCEQVEKIMEKNDGRMMWIQCFEGNNALDFQLVTCLGAMVAEKRAREYVIISKDTGFDAVVKFWGRDGVDIRRSKGAPEELRYLEDKGVLPRALPQGQEIYPDAEVELIIDEQQPVHEETPVLPVEEYGQKESGKKDRNKKRTGKKHEKKLPKGKREKNIAHMAKSIDIRDMSLFHNAFVAFFGAEEGDEYYFRLKEMGEQRKEFEKAFLKDRHQRIHNYVELMMETGKQDKGDVEKLCRIIQKAPKKDLQKLNTMVTKEFEAKKAALYYKLIKRHINIIRKL